MYTSWRLLLCCFGEIYLIALKTIAKQWIHIPLKYNKSICLSLSLLLTSSNVEYKYHNHIYSRSLKITYTNVSNWLSVSLWRNANALNVRLYYPYWKYTNVFIFLSLLCPCSTLRLFQFKSCSLICYGF